MTDKFKDKLSVVLVFVSFLAVLIIKVINKSSVIDGVYVFTTLFLMGRYLYIKKME